MTEEKNVNETSDDLIDSLMNASRDGRPLDSDEQDTNPASSQEENKEKEDPSHQGDEDESEEDDSNNTDDEKQLPFHEHPRFKKLIQDKNSKDKLIQDLQEKVEKLSQQSQTQGEIPPEFVQLFGDDERAWNLFNGLLQKQTGAVKQSILSEMQIEQQKALKADQEAKDYVDDEIQRLKDGGHKFNTKELKGIMSKYKPTLDDGNLDFDAGLQLYNDLKEAKKDTKKIQAKKTIADMTNSDTSSETDIKDYFTPGCSRL